MGSLLKHLEGLFELETSFRIEQQKEIKQVIFASSSKQVFTNVFTTISFENKKIQRRKRLQGSRKDIDKKEFCKAKEINT